MERLRRRRLIVVTFLGTAAATFFPIFEGMLAAEKVSQDQERVQVERVAEAAIRRIHLVTDQAYDAVDRMGGLREERCSPSYIEGLRQITADYGYIRDAGAYREAGYLCSAINGISSRGANSLPAPDYIADGHEIWFDAPNPIGGGRRRIVIGKAGSLVDAIDLSMRRSFAVNTIKSSIVATSAGGDNDRMITAVQDRASGRRPIGRFVIRQTENFPIAIIVDEPPKGIFAKLQPLSSTGVFCGVALGLTCGAFMRRFLSRRLSLEAELEYAIGNCEGLGH